MIDDIHVGVTPHTYSKVLDKIPETAIQSKFSMGYILARAVVDGKVTLDTFTEEAIRDTSVIGLAEKVHMEVDPELEEDAEGSHPSKVTIRLKDGRTISGRVDYAKGTAKKWPLTPEELRDKLINCARRALREKAVLEAAAMIEKLETSGFRCTALPAFSWERVTQCSQGQGVDHEKICFVRSLSVLSVGLVFPSAAFQLFTG